MTNLLKALKIIILLLLIIFFINIIYKINSKEFDKVSAEQTVKVSLLKFLEYTAIITSKTNKNNFDIKVKENTKIIKTNARTSTEIYYKNLNSLLIAKNPTNINLITIKLVDWAGDSEPFYTLSFKNTNMLNAIDFNVYINNDTIKFNHSKTSNVFYNKNLSISGNGTLNYPLVSISELANYLKEEKEKILGVGLTPNIPYNILQKATEVKEVISKEFTKSQSSVTTESLLITYSYKTIFDEEKSKSESIYFYIDEN